MKPIIVLLDAIANVHIAVTVVVIFLITIMFDIRKVLMRSIMEHLLKKENFSSVRRGEEKANAVHIPYLACLSDMLRRVM
ncbi:unnamed protein product [Toxocara canis]|uniref:Anoctamin n=1 Tax=Toxocara canis TaxID=6265 RepID=A0A183ULK2_TOXCA|nr:unnamed protein product [Toxocara canis]